MFSQMVVCEVRADLGSLVSPKFLFGFVNQALVVQKLDSAIPRINNYPVDKY